MPRGPALGWPDQSSIRAPPAPTYVDDRLAHWAEHTPDAEAITYLGRTWTWAQWDDRVRRAAGALQALGIGRGDVVAFLDKNHPACVELTLAAGSLGAANAIVNCRLAGDEVDYAVNDSGAKVLLVGTELMPTIDKIRDRLHQRRAGRRGDSGRRRRRRVRGAARRGRARRRGRRGRARRRLPGHVLLGHDRPPQGRDADPGQHGRRTP